MDDTNATTGAAGIVERLIGQMCRDVAELPDRDSPDDWPEAMLVTSEELEIVASRAFEAAATTIAAQAAEIERLREGMAPKPKGTDCSQSPTGFHVVDTTMMNGSNNCFYCEADMRGYVPGVVVRPTQPMADDSLWYRGWEAGHDDTAARYVKECWIAYKGGCDLDARAIAASSWDALLDEIDAEMGSQNDGE